MTTARIISSLLGTALIFGCTERDPGETSPATTTGTSQPGSGDETSSGGDDGPGATDPDAPTTSPIPPATSGETGIENTTAPPADTDDDTCGFLCPTDSGSDDVGVCDVFAQDCPEEEKCAAFIEGGESAWNATKCVPVTGEGAPGDACLAEGGAASGLDDCQKGAMCWDVDTESKGVCAELCGGSEAAPTCSDAVNFQCVVVNEGVLNLCLPVCDPLVQDCAGDHLCIPVADGFVCAPDASGDAGKAFDPCEFANVCDKGLYCMPPSGGMECDTQASGCCVPFCDLSMMDTPCPGEGQSCTPWFEEGTAPPDYANVGICIIPE